MELIIEDTKKLLLDYPNLGLIIHDKFKEEYDKECIDYDLSVINKNYNPDDFELDEDESELHSPDDELERLKMLKKLNTQFMDDMGKIDGLYPLIEYKDEYDGGGMILINRNQESKYFNHLYILYGDDHCRVGLFKCKEINMREVFEKMQDLSKEDEDGSELDTSNNKIIPFKKYMMFHNYETHYG
jgi:hypothetical protein